MSFDVAEGQLFCLLGPNGAGKTTTVSLLTTTLALTGGRVLIAGHDLITAQARVREEIGVVFQQPSLDVNLTAEQNIRLHAVLYGLYPWRPAWRLMPAAYRRAGGGAGRDPRASPSTSGARCEGVVRRHPAQAGDPAGVAAPARGCCSWTSRPPAWTRTAAAACGLTCGRSAPSARPRSSSPPTTWLRPRTADAICVLARGQVIERGSPAEIKARQLDARRPRAAGDTAGRPALEDAYLALLEAAGRRPAGPP